MRLPCVCLAFAMRLPCISNCHAVAMHLPCICHAFAMELPCFNHGDFMVYLHDHVIDDSIRFKKSQGYVITSSCCTTHMPVQICTYNHDDSSDESAHPGLVLHLHTFTLICLWSSAPWQNDPHWPSLFSFSPINSRSASTVSTQSSSG
jgi:hypothetical protein